MIQNLKLRTKLVAIAVPPLVILGVIAAYSFVASRGSGQTADELVGDIQTLGVAALAAFLITALTVILIGRSISDPLGGVSTAVRELAQVRLPAMLETLRNPAAPTPSFEPLEGGTDDEVGELIASLNDLQTGIVQLSDEQRTVVREGLSELVVNLARRNQSLLDRQIEVIDQLEAAEEDPDRLEELFGLDHLATRMRRNAESLLVVAGAEPSRRKGGPVAVADVLRVAMSEIEDYRHVQLVSIEDAEISPQAAVDLAHLFSELLENATQFSPPDSPVELTGTFHPSGSYMISCVDHGIGMTAEQLGVVNHVLADPPELGLGLTRSMGFIVIGRLAQRLGVQVELTHTSSGGITAIAEVPASVLSGLPTGAGDIASMPAAPAPQPAAEMAAPTAPDEAAMPPAPTVPPAPTALDQPPAPVSADELLAPPPAPPAPVASASPSFDPFGSPDPAEEAWTPPPMPERGGNPFGGSRVDDVQPAATQADPLEAPPTAPAESGAFDVPTFETPPAAAAPAAMTPDVAPSPESATPFPPTVAATDGPAFAAEASSPAPLAHSPMPVPPATTHEAPPSAPAAGVPSPAAASDALAKLLGIAPASLDSVAPTPAAPAAPTPPMTDAGTATMFGRPVPAEPREPEAPWTEPVFDPSALEINHERAAAESNSGAPFSAPAQLEEAIPTGDDFDSGVAALLDGDADRTNSGLVKRDRSKSQAPVSEGRPIKASVRSPDEIRSMLARYRSGLKGKPLEDLANEQPPMPPSPDPFAAASPDAFAAPSADAFASATPADFGAPAEPPAPEPAPAPETQNLGAFADETYDFFEAGPSGSSAFDFDPNGELS